MKKVTYLSKKKYKQKLAVMNRRILVVCTTDSMIWNFLVPHIKELEQKGFYVECACAITGDFYKDLIGIHGIKMNEIPFVRSPYNIKNLHAYKALCKLIKEKNFGTIFCHEPVGGAMGRIAGRKNHCKVIYAAHGFHFYKGAPIINRFLYYCIEKFLSLYTDALITINEEDYHAAQNFYAKKVYKINGIGIDIEKFSKIDNCDDLRQELSFKRGDFILFSVGELIKRKNHVAIIEALKQIDNPHIHYVIAGNGELFDLLNEKIRKLELSGQVHLLGYRTDINRLCNSADVFILPSLQEGLSVALMEAMACAKPIIASKIRGNVDLIDDNIGGILVEPTDVAGFADAILYCYNNPEVLAKYAQHNISKVREYDVNKVKTQLSSIYNECLGD